MSTRICIPIHMRRTYRNCSIKFFSRHCSPRHLLRSSPLPLCIKNRSCIRYFRRIQSLIPSLYWINDTTTMSKSPILNNVRRSKPNILPSTFLRISWIPSTIFRLPRHIYYMKRNLVNWIYDIFRRSTIFYFYSLRSTSFSTTFSIYASPSISCRMTI